MKEKSNIIAKIKELFAETKMAADYTATSNEIIRVFGDFAVGAKVVQVVGGEETTLPDGSYPLDNGKSIMVEAGEIKEVNDYPVKEEMGEELPSMTDEEEMADEYKNEIMTKLVDGTEVKILSKGEAASIGDMVMVKSGDEFVIAPSGEHKLEGGLTIYTDEKGFINELESEETEKIDEEGVSEEMKTMFEAVETLKRMIDDLKKENDDLKSNFQKFSKAPSTESITKKSQTNSVLTSKYEKAKNLFGR